MVESLLYMFEFVVSDLLITKPNECAPDEFPTCVTIQFRDNVFVSVCEMDFGEAFKKDPKCNNKERGRGVVFSIDEPITENDALYIEVSKKKTEKCKFVLGDTWMKIKKMFDKVVDDFMQNNEEYAKSLIYDEPDMGAEEGVEEIEEVKKGTEGEVADEGEEGEEGEEVEEAKGDKQKVKVEKSKEPKGKLQLEEFQISHDISKNLLTLFIEEDNAAVPSGNLVLITRLYCLGPQVVSPYAFNSYPPPVGSHQWPKDFFKKVDMKRKDQNGKEEKGKESQQKRNSITQQKGKASQKQK